MQESYECDKSKNRLCYIYIYIDNNMSTSNASLFGGLDIKKIEITSSIDYIYIYIYD